MAIRFTIKTTTGTVPVVMTKFFADEAAGEVREAVRAEHARRVVFLDTGATPVLVKTVRSLHDAGLEVVVRDHHRGEGKTPEAAAEIEALLWPNGAKIKTRAEAPACAGLVHEGEFGPEGRRNPAFPGLFGSSLFLGEHKATLIVADPDPDGLLAAMKAAGVVYVGLDADAAVLDGPRSEQTAERLTPFALLLVKGMATLPNFDPREPWQAEIAKEELFASFVQAAQGNQVARAALTKKVWAYEAGVAEAEHLCSPRP